MRDFPRPSAGIYRIGGARLPGYSSSMTRVSGVVIPTKEAQKMETAKVDIRKLQLLNDRINQCIDALNQVRLSVHGLLAGAGLSHTSPFFPGVNPGIPTGFG